jgi:hemerythrin-like domain-containing protein
MENPIQTLLEEHNILLKATESSKALQNIANDSLYRKLLHDVIIFFRNFTEIYHHPKEEDFLYPLLRNRSENMSEKFIKEIFDNHEDFKSLMAEIENYYISFNYKLLRSTFNAYLKLMKEHILRENSIVLSVAEKILSKEELIVLAQGFKQLDEKNGEKNELINTYNKISLQFA